MDSFIYSGRIAPGDDLDFMQMVDKSKSASTATLFLCTPGGSPDAAYKMGKYLQKRYDDFSIVISGYCKSAGTLLAISAKSLVFTPFGELGPLDIQMSKQDNLTGLESGLNTSAAFSALEGLSKTTFHSLINEIISNSGGVISFATAASAAADVISSMYGPIFAQIDPEEVGSRMRGMSIGEDYGHRLNQKFGNLRPNGVEFLSQDYPNHGFVIDMEEAQILFSQVREADAEEKELVEALGIDCRIPNREVRMAYLNDTIQPESEGVADDEKENCESSEDDQGRNPGGASNGKNSTGSSKTQHPEARETRSQAD